MQNIFRNKLAIIGVIVMTLLSLYFFYENKTKQAEELIDAAMEGDIKKMHFLIASGFNPDGIAYDGLTPMVAAVQRHQYESINYLISIGSDINKGDENHLTPLFYAALQGDESMYDFLMQRGAQFHFPDLLREKYLRDVVAGSKNQSLIDKINLQISKESASSE